MRHERLFRGGFLIAVIWSFVGLAWPAIANAEQCASGAPNVAQVGPTCVDKYEESGWSFPQSIPLNLLKRIKNGTATLANLISAGGVQFGVPLPAPANTVCNVPPTDYPPTFPVNGNWTMPLYAVTLPAVPPSVCISWFQAEQACALSGKRLLTNQEWQRAAASTPDVAPLQYWFFSAPHRHFCGLRINVAGR